MSISLLMDVHVRRAITEGLRRSGVDVLTAQEDGSAKLSDPELLDRATILGRVLFSQDDEIGNTPRPSNSTKQPSDLALCEKPSWQDATTAIRQDVTH